MQTQFVMICSRDFWLKTPGTGARVWALIDAFSGGDINVYLINDESAIIASRQFRSLQSARERLRAEGYLRLLEDRGAQASEEAPGAPFYVDRRSPPREAAAFSLWPEPGHPAPYA